MRNEYLPIPSKILKVKKHTELEYTFSMEYHGDVKPGQFFELSIPKYGEAPISVSGINADSVDLTVRRVGKVTNEVFEHWEGDTLFMRGPYGNGFDLDEYRGKELLVVAGGTGLSPVRGVVDYFASNPDQCNGLTLVCGFKTPADILFFEDQARWKQTSNVILTVDKMDTEFTCDVGMVTEHIPKIEFKDTSEAVAIVVGPPMMMHFTAQLLLDLGFKERNIWVSQERKMHCGIGKCGHCKVGRHYICIDGPVFNYSLGKNLID